MIYFLIGMPGVGKTTFGDALATQLQLPFIDLDSYIEQREGCTIAQLFTKGETYFRSVESDALLELLHRKDAFVLACGGGTPCFNNNLQVMKSKGIVVYLKAEMSTILARISKQKSSVRPLLDSAIALQQQLTHLYQSRVFFYEQADAIILLEEQVNDKFLLEVVNKLSKLPKI